MSFNPNQLSTWSDAMRIVKVINSSASFQAAGISILPQDPQHKHSGAYIPSWTDGGGNPPPQDGNRFFIHYRYSNGMEGMNAGLVQDKFSRFPTSPLYVLSQLLIEVQEGART